MRDFVGLEPRTFGKADNLGESVSAWVRHRFPRDTAKHLAQFAGLDPKTAQNIVIARHVSGPSLAKIARAFGWEFWADIGAALLRQTYDEAIAQELKDISDAQRRLDDLEAAVRNRQAALRARRALDAGRLVLVPPNGGAAPRRDSLEDRALGAGSPPR